MRICLILYMIDFISSIQYNQRCTFSFGTCNWKIGRRWQIKNLVDEIDDKVLIAIDGSNDDKKFGFTDVITSSWLYLTSSCSFDIRLTFQFNIENEQDKIEVFLIKKDRTQISSVKQWKALPNQYNNSLKNIESFWQQADIIFKATEEFRIEIEIRHLPDKKNDSTTWFAIDDILIESCPNVRTTTTHKTEQTITTISSWSTQSYLNINNSSLIGRSFFHFRWKFNDSYDSLEESFKHRLTLPTFILYILCTLIALTLLIIFLAIIIFTYRKYCLPSSTLSAPIIDHRYRSSRKKKHNSHIDQDARTEKTMVTTIRGYY